MKLNDFTVLAIFNARLIHNFYSTPCNTTGIGVTCFWYAWVTPPRGLLGAYASRIFVWLHRDQGMEFSHTFHDLLIDKKSYILVVTT